MHLTHKIARSGCFFKSAPYKARFTFVSRRCSVQFFLICLRLGHNVSFAQRRVAAGIEYPVRSIMEFQLLSFLLLGAFMLDASAHVIHINAIRDDYGIGALNRSTFPSGFIFGTASSAYQVTSSYIFFLEQ